jgi:hypothetical protein
MNINKKCGFCYMFASIEYMHWEWFKVVQYDNPKSILTKKGWQEVTLEMIIDHFL